MSPKFYLIVCLLLSGVSIAKGDTYTELVDCTAIKWPESKNYFMHLPKHSEVKDWMRAIDVVTNEEILARSVSSATEWALKNGYLPCEYEMCGAVMKNKVGGYTVRLSAKDDRFIGPDAIVSVDPIEFKIIDSGRWHSGCNSRKLKR